MTRVIRYLLPVMVLAWAEAITAQQVFTVWAYDLETGKPVNHVIVWSSDMKVLASTSESGAAKVVQPYTISQVTLTHTTYRDTTLEVARNMNTLRVNLTPRLYHLKTFTLTALPTPLLPEKPWYITSYVHCNAGLLLFAAPRKNLSKRSLYLVDTEGNVTATLLWPRQGTLWVDASGDVWFKGAQTATLLEVDRERISATDLSVPLEEFEKGIARIELASGNSYYFRHLSADNQQADFYHYNHQSRGCEMFYTTSNPLGIKLRETRDIFETNEFERRFGEMCFFRPVAVHLLSCQSHLVLVNYAADEILHLDSTLEVSTAAIPIGYHKSKQFKRNFIYDKATEKYYVLFEKEGIQSIQEINLTTGVPGLRVTLPDFPFTEEISVHNGILWFLYDDGSERGYKRIYRLPLPGTEVKTDHRMATTP